MRAWRTISVVRRADQNPAAAGPSPMDRAAAMLRAAFGESARFRSGQWDAIEAVLREGHRRLVIERTGWGKSAVYLIATRLVRERGVGTTLVISPLLALMRNQIDMAARLGVRAACLNSWNRAQWASVQGALERDEVDLLLIAPERLADGRFRRRVLSELAPRTGLLVIDEAHCVSDWGHDFRPDYLRLRDLLSALNPWASVLAMTATANGRVLEDLRSMLGHGLRVQRGSLWRPGLQLSSVRLEDHGSRLAWLAKYVPRLPASGIVYALTVADCEQVASWLQSRGIDAVPYHADLPAEERIEREDRFAANDLKCLVATSAFGMGYDKDDVGFVVHYQMPGSTAAYFQQVGRAGRATGRAFGVLLEGEADLEISRHFIDSAAPPEWAFQALIQGLESGPASLQGLLPLLPASAGTVARALDLLQAEGVVGRTERDEFLLVDASRHDESRSQRLAEARREELATMVEYARTTQCRKRFLSETLGDPSDAKCGECDNCRGGPASRVSFGESEAARSFLASRPMSIEPRERFPGSVIFEGRRSVPRRLRHLAGVALSSYGDRGWGRLVAQGKYESLEYSDELVEAAARAIEERGFVAHWLTWIPSARHGAPIRSFALRLAQRLGTEAVDALRRKRPGKPQKLLQHAEAQWRNVWDAFETVEVRNGPCLLVDDVVDSGWTLAAAAAAILDRSEGPVMPLALASSKPRSRWR
jgi:ATP-dependent DNA helicase RecQ